MKTFEQIAELERRYLLGTYNRYPIVLTRGKGVFLYDPGSDFSRPLRLRSGQALQDGVRP
jgi:acetylornithine/succinyldiaminopimelate/putrescine aminotransferase